MTTAIISLILIIICIIIFFNINTEEKQIDRSSSSIASRNEISIRTTQMSYLQNDEVINESFIFKPNYNNTEDLARIYDNGYIDLYKRIPNTSARFGVTDNGRKFRTDSFIMDDERYDVTFIQNSDIKISILTLKHNLVTNYK